MSRKVVIRLATRKDAPVLAEFNTAMALETENKNLHPEVVSRGVENLLANPDLGFYLVAEAEQEPVGALMVTTEWSDWRNGVFWWIQSVYVRPHWRRKGVFRLLYQQVKELAGKDSSVCGFRLYVERENITAQRTYQAVGMEQTPYRMFEELFR